MSPCLRLERDVTAFGGDRAQRRSNDDVELIVATEYGPRVLAYRRPGGANVFGFLDPVRQGKVTPFGDLWHIYGGHRLWHAPEPERHGG